MKKGLSFKIRREIHLAPGDTIVMVTSDSSNKFWLESGKRQISQPIKGNEYKNNPKILRINRTLKK